MIIHDSIVIKDNVLSEEQFVNFRQFCTEKTEFQSLLKGDHVYHVAETPKEIETKVLNTLEQIHQRKIDLAVTFLRLANSRLDTDLRIHCDNGNVSGKFCPSHGAIFYITHDIEFINGTALWKHKKYGYTCPDNFDQEDIQNFLMADKDDPSKWDLSTIIGGVENRLVTYPAKYFHSKYPSVMTGKEIKNSRIIMVLFYKIL
jgi:hypothetical protein